MEFYDEANHPGRLPEPITLVGPSTGSLVDADGVVLSCEASENAVGYQLLFGADPHHMVYLFSDTPSPPTDFITSFPFAQTWWTVRAYDAYGSTIYADPLLIRAGNVRAQTVENVLTGQTYTSIQQAINDAHSGDDIVISAGDCQFLENIDFKGKSLTLRSTDPNDPDVMATTVIRPAAQRPVVTFSGSEDADCVLAGLTITGDEVGISCGPVRPTIRNCTIVSDEQTAIRFWEGHEPSIIDCTVLGQVEAVSDPSLVACWALDETEGDVARDSVGDKDGTLFGDPVWEPEDGKVNGALAFDGVDDYIATDECVVNPSDGSFAVLAWIKGGVPGQVIVSQDLGSNWLAIDAKSGGLMTAIAPPQSRFSTGLLISDARVADGLWHRVALVWDGSTRALYVDGTLVAADEQDGLVHCSGGLNIGCDTHMVSNGFFTGLIDDVRIYNRAMRP
jgi:hypothetical protein